MTKEQYITYAANKALLANPNANISDITIYVSRTLGVFCKNFL